MVEVLRRKIDEVSKSVVYLRHKVRDLEKSGGGHWWTATFCLPWDT